MLFWRRVAGLLVVTPADAAIVPRVADDVPMNGEGRGDAARPRVTGEEPAGGADARRERRADLTSSTSGLRRAHLPDRIDVQRRLCTARVYVRASASVCSRERMHLILTEVFSCKMFVSY